MIKVREGIQFSFPHFFYATLNEQAHKLRKIVLKRQLLGCKTASDGDVYDQQQITLIIQQRDLATVLRFYYEQISYFAKRMFMK